MEGAAPTTASEGAAKQPVAEATSPPREGKAPAEPAAAGGAVAASPPPAGAVAAAAPTAAPTAASGLRSFGELSTLPNCIRVSSVVYLSNVVERASRMLGIGGQSAAATTTDGTAAVAAPAAPAVEGGGSSTPPPPPPAEGAVVAQTFDTVHIVALGMAISRVATIGKGGVGGWFGATCFPTSSHSPARPSLPSAAQRLIRLLLPPAQKNKTITQYPRSRRALRTWSPSSN